MQEEKKKQEEKQAQAAMQKQKNPLDLLPETKLNFFDFKTMITNAADKQQAVDWLFDNFDAEGFSFWKVYYIKYEGEGEKLFMTNNLAAGFL